MFFVIPGVIWLAGPTAVAAATATATTLVGVGAAIGAAMASQK